MPQIPRAGATLLLGLEVNSNNIRANASVYLFSEKTISTNAFSYARSSGLFCGSRTRFSKINVAFLQISGTGCGVLITFNRRSTALEYIASICLVQTLPKKNHKRKLIVQPTNHLSVASFSRQSMLTSARLYNAPTAAA